MKKIAIVTDSNSGITQNQANELGVSVIPMPFDINNVTYYEDINLTQEEYYTKLNEGATISTSQPSIETITNLWDKLLVDYDEIVHIPMSSGLSGSCETAIMLSADYDNKVQVVNNQRISVTQRQSVVDAITLANSGKDALQIKKFLENVKFESSIYITLDTLYYLKKGGRITPAAAALGSLLKLKPVLQIQGEKLDKFSKSRTMKLAKSTMINAMKKDIEERFSDAEDEFPVYIEVAYTQDIAAANEWLEEVKDNFPGYEVHMDPLSLSIACHIGPGSLALACSKKINI